GKSGFPAPGELCDRIGLCREKLLIVAQPERCLLDTQWIFSAWKIVADCFEFFSADREKADLVEETQQPRLRELSRRAMAIPHLQRAADELIAARSLHAVHAHIRAADANRILRSPGARRVVFGGDQAMARIERGGYRRTEIDLAETHHHIAGIEHDFFDVFDAVEAVDAANEFDIARAPRSIPAHGLHVFFDGEPAGGVIPRQRQPDDARWHLQ